MNLPTPDHVGQRLLAWFAGQHAPADLLALIACGQIGGVTLFRHLNGGPPAQIRTLTTALQAAAHAAGQPPVLICADQEGGQLVALPNTTAFPGNMALGATGDPALAQRVGAALGRELAALGVNVNFAPVCDVNVNPTNPVIGVRAFGSDPALVGRMSAAMITGLQSSGVAATAKHFPGHGDTAADSHHHLGVVPHSLERLRRVELPPFAAAVHAGAKLVMSAHLAVPALGGHADLPATRDPAVLHGLLRGELGFRGVIVSDALNMAGFASQGDPLERLAEAANAGVDLLLLGEPLDPALAYATLRQSQRDPAHDAAALQRILNLKHWLSTHDQPPLASVGCAEHQALAADVAARAITLVRDRVGRLPLRLAPDARIIVVTPELQDLTPADTSSYERCSLDSAVRAYHANTTALTITADPAPNEVAALLEQLRRYDLVIIGTIDAAARPGLARLVTALAHTGPPMVTVALRLPYDLLAYPAAPTCLCTYSVLPPAMTALAATLFGAAPAPGQLPVTLDRV